VIQRELQNPLAEKILQGGISEGETVKVTATGNDKLAISTAKRSPGKTPSKAAE